ncbi:MAG: hypothetical protein GY816_16235 [Cytophagales bacterium]|nr:hypothetical protein [Cytophagales bacterium]
MKFFLRLILIGILSYFLSMIAPWWIIVVIGFSCGLLIPGGSLRVFVSGFLGVGIVWLGQAWKLDSENESSFSNIILELFPISDSIVLIAFVGLLGGLCGGLSAMSGSLFRQPDSNKKPSGYYQ